MWLPFSPPINPQTIELRHGALRLAMRPDLGASITGFQAGSQSLLRDALTDAPDNRDPTQLACFPLVPYSNRIAQGAFTWDGRRIELQRNFGGHPHSIHGCAWLAPWQVIAQSEHSVQCEYQHSARQRPLDWPWEFVARQDCQLTADGCSIALHLTNQSSRSMPAGIGLHPYFPRTRDTLLDVQFSGEWLTDEHCLPTSYQSYQNRRNPWRDGRLASRVADAAFTERSRAATITWPGQPHALRVSSSTSLAHTVVYVPEDADFFCFEPVSHLPNAHNRPEPASDTGLIALAPGATLSGHMQLTVIAGATTTMANPET